MENFKQIIDFARKTIEIEVDSLNKLTDFINEDFVKSVQTILNSKGRVVITGIGKSAIIAQKIVATMNSTGTPSIFMHAADAIHGDLGIIQKDDVLAVSLMQMKQFGSKDFAKYHPGGALGKKLYLTVGDAIAKNEVPKVSPETDIKQVIIEISQKMLGVTAVIDGEKIVGVITDGDIRRMLNKFDNIQGLKAKDIMSINPKTINYQTLAVDALDFMQNHKITQLLVTKDNIYIGIIHLHNLIQEGII